MAASSPAQAYVKAAMSWYPADETFWALSSVVPELLIRRLVGLLRHLLDGTLGFHDDHVKPPSRLCVYDVGELG